MHSCHIADDELKFNWIMVTAVPYRAMAYINFNKTQGSKVVVI